MNDGRPAYEELAFLTDTLPPKERAAVVLRYGYDLDYEQIASALDSSPDAARQAASSGVRRLRRRSHMTVPTDLDLRFRDAAVRAELLDAAYDVIESEVGPLLAAVTDRGLARITYDPDPERELERLARLAGPRVLRAPRALDETRRELDDYFAGRRKAFDLELDLRGQARFAVAVLDELAKVPYGRTATYGELGDPRGQPACGPRGGDGDEPEPDPDRPAVPPHRRRLGQPRRLRRRARAEGAPASPRRGHPLTLREGGIRRSGSHPRPIRLRRADPEADYCVA